MPIVKLLVAFSFLFTTLIAGEYDDFEFDVEQYEKKHFEAQGYVRSDNTVINLERDVKKSTLNELNLQADIDVSNLDLHVDLSTFYKDDSISHEQNMSFSLNAITQHFGNEKISLELGKKVQRWGKGYAYSALALFEPQKDRLYPELAREGFWMSDLSLTQTFNENALKNINLTLLAIPNVKDNEILFQQSPSNFAMKFYMLLWDIDIDVVLANETYGLDLSLNLLSELEVHGEFGRVNEQNSYLLGLRYQTATDLTLIAEYSKTYEAGSFYYLKATQKEPFSITYLSAYLLYMQELEVDSYKMLTGIIYDFKNGWVIDTAFLANKQGEGGKVIGSFFF